MPPLLLALTDHVEAPADRPSAEAYAAVAEIVREADRLGVEYAWFSEHHGHAHYGHLPVPLLLALHLAGQTERIHLGTAIVCLNLHHPLDVAEQVAVADTLTGGRIAAGFGSGSTPEEFGLFGLDVTGEAERHGRFEEALRLMQAVWRGGEPFEGRYYSAPRHHALPAAEPDLAVRSWLAVNSVGSARIAGSLGFNMMLSHLRTPEQYREYRAAYTECGGRGLVAANRPVYVGRDDASAWREAEPALRTLWRRFRQEGKIPADRDEPEDPRALCAHPINFLVGGTKEVARQVAALRAAAPFDVLNAELHWAGLSQEQLLSSLRLLATEVRSRVDGMKAAR